MCQREKITNFKMVFLRNENIKRILSIQGEFCLKHTDLIQVWTFPTNSVGLEVKGRGFDQLFFFTVKRSGSLKILYHHNGIFTEGQILPCPIWSPSGHLQIRGTPFRSVEVADWQEWGPTLDHDWEMLRVTVAIQTVSFWHFSRG